MQNHIWQKKSTPDKSQGRLVRSWTCTRCGASKTVIKNTKDTPPRHTIERIVSREKCQ